MLWEGKLVPSRLKWEQEWTCYYIRVRSIKTPFILLFPSPPLFSISLPFSHFASLLCNRETKVRQSIAIFFANYYSQNLLSPVHNLAGELPFHPIFLLGESAIWTLSAFLVWLQQSQCHFSSKMTKVLTHLKRGQQSQLCTACFCLLMCQRLTSPSDPFLQPGEEFFSNKTVEDVLVTTWTKDKMVTIPWSAKLWEAVKVSFVCESTCTALSLASSKSLYTLCFHYLLVFIPPA